jgi:hypothetical protein
VRADSDRCAICGGKIGDTVYTITDEVTHEKLLICNTCVTWPDDCFICGLPVRKDYTRLSDGRFLCARDAKTAVLDNDDAKQICDKVKDDLDRMFSRFLTFPGSNVDIAIVDRVSLLAFKIPGNDFECPNLLGYIQPKTNHGQVRYAMSLMSALPRAEFKATCAHEYTHAWVFANLSPARRETLGPDAHEGFCELVAYRLMDSQGEEEEKRAILKNTYTRGQIHLFIDAEKRYGFNDIVDWMKYGVEAQLDGDHLGSVRTIQFPRLPRPANRVFLYPAISTTEPDTLVLRGLSSAREQLFALINDRTLAVGETGRIRVGKTNVLVRCLAIGDHSVRIQIVDSGQLQELQLKAHKP